MDEIDLDEYFGSVREVVDPQSLLAENASTPEEQGLQAGLREPREFYRLTNRATQALALAVSEVTGIPVKSTGGQNQHKRCAHLLADFKDLDLLLDALVDIKRKGVVQPGANLYYLAKIIENKASQLQAIASKKVETWTDVAEEAETDESILCSACGLEVFQFNSALECIDCEGQRKRTEARLAARQT